MFWENLTQLEQDDLYGLMQSTKPYLAWASLSNTKKKEIPSPPKPSDNDFMTMELLSMKGWRMID